METKAFKKLLNLYISLLELHGENQFKIRNLASKVFNLDRISMDFNLASREEMEDHPGIGKKIAESILCLRESGSFPDLDEYLSKTPEGVVEMLGIKGIGSKKVGVLWRDLGVETIEQLYEAGMEGKIAKLPGFGEKTQKIILESLDYSKEQEGKGLFAEWEVAALALEEKIKSSLPKTKISRVGALAMGDDILESLDWLCEQESLEEIKNEIVRGKEIKILEPNSGPFVIRGTYLDKIPFSIRAEKSASFGNSEVYFSSPPAFLKAGVNNHETVISALKAEEFSTSEKFFKSIGTPFISSELRHIEGVLLEGTDLGDIIEDQDITGVLHAHSNYSDGLFSIEEMANASIEKGYHYFGLSDHSRSAFYANGLDEDRIALQHLEVDELNKKLAPFKIFKGIESDILADGSLDYHEEVLAKFDFIVASVHSNLNMDERKATARLLNAIENPFTTMLGHPTGRLLLKREGYPINHKMIIEACAANGVVIEINANPWRLDLDWKWVGFAQEKGVLISINPDAHTIDGIDDIHYGVLAGRKGGLKKANTLNARPMNLVEDFFRKRKPS